MSLDRLQFRHTHTHNPAYSTHLREYHNDCERGRNYNNNNNFVIDTNNCLIVNRAAISRPVNYDFSSLAVNALICVAITFFVLLCVYLLIYEYLSCPQLISSFFFPYFYRFWLTTKMNVTFNKVFSKSRSIRSFPWMAIAPIVNRM